MGLCTDDLVEGDTSELVVTCRNKDDEAILDITGQTVMLRFRIKPGEQQERDMTIVDGPNGVASYQFAADELTPGTLTYRAFIVSGGDVWSQVCVGSKKVAKKDL